MRSSVDQVVVFHCCENAHMSSSRAANHYCAKKNTHRRHQTSVHKKKERKRRLLCISRVKHILSFRPSMEGTREKFHASFEGRTTHPIIREKERKK